RAPAHERAELEERGAEPVLAGFAVLLEEARACEGRGEPVHGALGEPQTCGEGGDAELVLLAGERGEDPNRVGYRRKASARRSAVLRLFHVVEKASCMRNAIVAPRRGRACAARPDTRGAPRRRSRRSTW